MQPAPPTENSGAHTRPPLLADFITARTSVYGTNPVEMDCPNCNAHIVSHVQRIAGKLTWMIATACFIAGFFLLVPWCLCCIPFLADSCLDVLHHCPACKAQLGRFKHI